MPVFLITILLILLLEKMGWLSALQRGSKAPMEEGTALCLEGQVYRKEVKSGSFAIYLRKAFILTTEGTKIPSANLILVSDQDTYPIGTILTLDGTVALFTTPRNEGNFNEAAYYRARKIGYRFFPTAMLSQTFSKNPYWKGKEALYQLSLRIADLYQKLLSENAAGILKAMVLGNKSSLPQEVKERFQANGISHVLAISGLHVSILGLSLFHLLRRKFKYGISCTIAALTISIYFMMVGGNASIFRAVIMCSLLLLANYLGRTYDPSSALSLAGILLLIQSPYMLWDTGFQLSVAAIVGTIYMTTYLYSYYDSVPWWQKSVLMGLSIQLTTLPLASFYFYEIPLFAILLNLLVLPMMGPVLALGMTGGLLGGLGILPAAKLILPAGWFLNLLCRLPKLPTLLCGKPDLWQIVFYYLILSIFGILFLYRDQKKYLPGMFSVLILLYLPINRNPQLVMLDVGQGDGLYLTDGAGMDCMIDGGSSTEKQVGSYQILPFLKSRRVRSIDYWFVSHGDSDHISGLLELLEDGYPVKNLVLSEIMPQDDAYDSLVAAANTVGTKILLMKQGEQWESSAFQIRDVTPGGSDITDRNQNSMVLYIHSKWGKGCLLGGDITAEEESKIVSKHKGLIVTYLKADHHGSGYSNSETYLAGYQAPFCLISVGEGNNYGHPHQEAIQRMKEAGMEIMETRKLGEIVCPME